MGDHSRLRLIGNPNRTLVQEVVCCFFLNPPNEQPPENNSEQFFVQRFTMIFCCDEGKLKVCLLCLINSHQSDPNLMSAFT